MCDQDFVIWTAQGDNNGIHAGVKETGEKLRGVVHPGVGVAYDVITYDRSTQPLVNSMSLTYLCSNKFRFLKGLQLQSLYFFTRYTCS